MRLHCNKCKLLVVQKEREISGCLCDPDSPSWIAIEPTGRILKMSHADYEVITE